MNQREPRHASTAARRAIHCLSLLLLPALLPESMLSGGRARAAVGARSERQDTESAPYLPYLGSPPLRYREAAPPHDLAASPPAAAPPLPHLTAVESAVGQANSNAAHGVASNAPADAAVDTPKTETSTTPKSTPVSILPDTIRPQVQAEDFLPYFLIPDTPRNDASAARPPVPPSSPVPPDSARPDTLPPSTATYTQTPR